MIQFIDKDLSKRYLFFDNNIQFISANTLRKTRNSSYTYVCLSVVMLRYLFENTRKEKNLIEVMDSIQYKRMTFISVSSSGYRHQVILQNNLSEKRSVA